MLYPSLAVMACVLIIATVRAASGNAYARDFLWAWALIAIALLPFMKDLRNQMSAPAIVLVATTTIPLLFAIVSRRRQELEDAQLNLRRVLADSAKRTDEDRRRIARRLHDDINPRIVLGKLDLQHLAEITNGIEDAELRGEAQDIIRRTLESLATIYSEIRDVIKNTRIEMIDSIGLLAAVHSLVQHYQSVLERPAISFHTNLKVPPKWPETVTVSVYRMIQEALLNAVKHADATEISVTMEHGRGRYRIEIADNGKGLSARPGHGVGLIDLRERARLLDAEFRIANNKPRGTLVSFSLSDRR